MIVSFGIILLLGFIVGYILSKVKIPGLVGMIILGLVIGPYVLGLIDSSILAISSELRQMALVIILTRSGFNLDVDALKMVGRPAILMSFVPACLEIIGVSLISYFLLGLNIFECLLMGSVLAAVSPAVISPRMIKLIDRNVGSSKEVPKMILAASSLDDILVIILFYAFLGLNVNNSFNFLSISMIPVSIILGIVLGFFVGLVLAFIFKKFKFNLAISVLITLSFSFLMIGFENLVKDYVSISSLLGIMVMGITLLFKNSIKAKELSNGYNGLWLFFEIILFVLVGASLDYSYALENFLVGLVILIVGLSFRIVGVIISLIKTNLNFKEKIFACISYLPKATVQASIGGIALGLGLPSGGIILTVSILSILITAPIGALLIDNLSDKLLS